MEVEGYNWIEKSI